MKPRRKQILKAQPAQCDYELVVSECPQGVWIVVYQGRPIQVRREHVFRDEKKYMPNCWTQRGGAQRQAKILNELFHSSEFEIAEILGKTTA